MTIAVDMGRKATKTTKKKNMKILTEHHLEFLRLTGCTSSSESTLAKCHIVGNHMSRLNYVVVLIESISLSCFQ